MIIAELLQSLEELAPLPLQDDYDNSGLQVGLSGQDLKAVLVTLDITEDVIDEAARLGCNLIVSHHPLIFKALKKVTDASYQQRCVLKAIKNDIVLYAAHTNLDNAENGVNYKMAEVLGLTGLEWLSPREDAAGRSCGSGVIGNLPSEVDARAFLLDVKSKFGVDCLMHSEINRNTVRRVAICGGAGSFLMPDAIKAGADCFLTGEISYHHFFENDGLLVAALGHYQSEQYTKDLLKDYMVQRFPELRVEIYSGSTNPINYL